jgi:hypothetical protein
MFPASSRGEQMLSSAPTLLLSRPPPLPGGQSSMEREERPAQHQPSPHRGVERPRRTSSDQGILSQPCPPVSLSGVAGWTSRQAGRAGRLDRSRYIRPSTAPPRVLLPPRQTSLEGRTSPSKMPLQYPQMTPSPSTNDMLPWDTKRTSLLKVVPATRNSAFFAASPFYRP